jgi:hypothetical protein
VLEKWMTYHQLLPQVQHGGGVGLEWSPGAVFFSFGFQELQISKILLYVASHSVNVNSLECDSLSRSKPSNFLTPCLAPISVEV